GSGSSFGLALVDLATGEFRATAGDDAEVLIEELVRVAPREVLVAASLREHPLVARVAGELADVAVTPIDDDFFARAGQAAWVRPCGEGEAAAPAPVHPRPALSAGGAALAYAEKMQPRKGRFAARPPVLFHLRELRPYLPGACLVLDREARIHLELFRA